MIISNHKQEFKTEWQDLINFDPVQPPSQLRTIARRFEPDRRVFVLVEDNEPQAVLQVALTSKIPSTVTELWEVNADVPKVAIFYSVYKLPHIKFLGDKVRELILGAAKELKAEFPDLINFITFSPIPTLTKKLSEPDVAQIKDLLINAQDPVARFHMSNGAKLYAIWPNADEQDLRQSESWGWMASYKYEV
jgi:malonyl-CoA decarboxylase